MAGGKPGAPGAAWEDAASRLRAAGPGKELDGACRRLVDELEGTAGTGERGLEGATRALSALLPDLGHGARARVLAEAVGRVYAAPGNRGALGGLFGAIFESLDGDARTYAALEAVRAALLRVYVGAGEPGDSAGDVLGACYGALARVASDSRLGELSRLMGAEGARAAACAERTGIADLARLWRFVYDMRDIPDGSGINCALRRHGALLSVSNKARIRGARARISQFLLHIAEDHAMHEDYDTIYNVARESNMRIRYWLDEIYRQHGVRGNPYLLDRPATSVFYKPGLEWINLALAVKYLILELESFRRWERTAHTQIVKRLDVKNPDALYIILARRNEIQESVRQLRNVFGAHIDWTLNDVKREIDRIGLASIVRLGTKVLLFQDAAYRAIPHKYYRPPDPLKERPVRSESLCGEPARLEEMRKKYRSLDLRLNTACMGEWHAVHESFLCLYLTHARYLERHSGYDNTLDAVTLLTSELYNTKYWFLELCNIITRLLEIGLYTRPGTAFRPEFSPRKGKYCQIRADYAARVRTGKIKDLRQILDNEKELLSHVPYDIEELYQIVAILEKRLPELPASEIAHMTASEIRSIEGEKERDKESSHAYLHNRFRDPHEEQRRHDTRMHLERAWNLERRAEGGQSRPCPAPAPGAAKRTPASPLREAEDAVRTIGLERCPKEWLDDLVCGDYGGALARIRVHSALLGAEAAAAAPERPGGGPDMAAGEGEDRCRISVCALDNVPRMLGAAGHAPGAGRAVAAAILGAARARLADGGACAGQAALVVMDPGGAIMDHGGLEEALVSIGLEAPWVGAVAVVRAGRCEVRDVPRPAGPLRDGVRGMLCGLGPASHAPPTKPSAARDPA